MENGQEFVDYYDLLQVSPNCDARVLEVAYHYFAKIYHPDHAETADVEKFNDVTEAYKVLRDPDQRAEYDRLYSSKSDRNGYQYPPNAALAMDQDTAVHDAEIHEKILLCLYKKRREQPGDPGVVGWLLQEMLDFSEDDFEFHLWYLKSKGLIKMTEQGTMAITIEGVDHVISTSRESAAQKLLMSQSEQDDSGVDNL